jgi:hypothetical protein
MIENIIALKEIIKYEFSLKPYFIGNTKKDNDIQSAMSILNDIILEMIVLNFINDKKIKKLSDDFIALLLSLFDYGVEIGYDILVYYETSFDIIINYCEENELWEVVSNIKKFKIEFVKIINEYDRYDK